MPEEKVFYPRYPLKLKISCLGSLVFAAMGLLIVTVAPFANLGLHAKLTGFGCIIFFGLGAASWFLHPKKIEFGSNAIIVRRKFLSDKRIKYSDVTDVGIARLKSEEDGFGWGQMENGNELSEIIDQLIEEGIIPEYALEGEAVKKDLAGLYAAVITGIGLPLAGVLLWFGVLPARWFVWLVHYPDWLIKLVLPIGVFSIFYGLFRYVWFRGSAA